MRNIYLIEGAKNAGKSNYIHEKHKELLSRCAEIETINGDDWNTVIYILKDEQTNEIIILNSGSDTKGIIRNFGQILKRYPSAATVYTAIRPYGINPRLHKWMKDVLDITAADNVQIVNLPL